MTDKPPLRIAFSAWQWSSDTNIYSTLVTTLNVDISDGAVSIGAYSNAQVFCVTQLLYAMFLTDLLAFLRIYLSCIFVLFSNNIFFEQAISLFNYQQVLHHHYLHFNRFQNVCILFLLFVYSSNLWNAIHICKDLLICINWINVNIFRISLFKAIELII